ncbi:MAG TPA: hypothetical protein VFE73_06840 [Reyranella sp.]|jgi:ElaB/YqjD/DUF883 family membrane-anchored ribosome-binding protein|nr:hypothetical protein [Reyranella sp.]
MRNGTVHSIPSKDLVKEINALKAQLKRVSDAMANDASDGMNRAIDAVESKSRETIDDAVDAAQRFIDDYTDTAKDTASKLARTSSQMRDSAADSLVETVQARPFGTLAAVIGIGFLAGYLCRRT